MLLLALPSSRTSGHYAARLLPVMLPMVGTAWFAIRIVRLRLLTYLFFLWAMAFVVPGIRLLQATEPPFYQVNGIALIAVGLAPLWFPIRALLSPDETGDGVGG
jgi:hypothetical protein